MKYCEFCGNPIENGETCTCEEATKKATQLQNRKKKFKPIICSSIVVAFVLVVIITIVTASKKIDPTLYTEIILSGYHGQGEINVEFDTNKLIGQIIGEEPENLEEYFEWEEKYFALEDGLTLEYEPKKFLKNDDKVIIKIIATGAAASKIKSTEEVFVISGLPVLEEVDVFKDVELKYDGISGNAVAKLINNANSEPINKFRLSFSPMYNLKNGDIVTVEILNVDDMIDFYQVCPKEFTKEYTVSGLGKYVTSAGEIPSDLIAKFAQQFVDNKNEDKEQSFITESDARYYGAYLFIVNEDAWLNHNNELRIYICYDQYINGEFNETIYMPLIFKNVNVNANGNIDLSYEDGATSIFTTDIDNHFLDAEDEYKVIKID